MSQNMDTTEERRTAGSGCSGRITGRRRLVTRLPLLVGTAILLVAVAVSGVRYCHYAAQHVSTDDAYVTSDNTTVSPQVSGLVQKVLVSDNQVVRRGQLLVVLDDSSYRTAVEQAKADLNMAVAQANGAGASVDLTSETAKAQIMQAQGMVGQAESGIAGARAETTRAEAGVINARAAAKSADADVRIATAALSAAVANKERFSDSVSSAQAAVDAAEAVHDKAVRDSDRAHKLFSSGAISEEAADQASSTLLSARAALAGKRADLSAARQQQAAAEASIEQSNAQLVAARERVNSAYAAVRQAQAQSTATRESIRQAGAKRQQAVGQLSQAQTAPAQVAVSRSAKALALAKVDQARAALSDALLKLSYTRISAPVDGTVGRKAIQAGMLVQPGAPMMTVVEKGSLEVTANFKETQLASVKPGASAEIRVDAIRGRAFRGHVESLSKATGAVFALLPPDNATGNFTKVVQRVPVKIILDPNQPGLDTLRAGLSVVAVVSTGRG